MDILKSTVETLAAKANASSEIVTKEYINATTKLYVAANNAILTIEEKSKEVTTISTATITEINAARHLPLAPTSTYLPSTSFQKSDYPNEYFIDGQKR